MIEEPKCYKRKCKHYIGVINDGLEENERHSCPAFLDGIPGDIAYGNNLHLEPSSNQDNNIIYEKEEEQE